ncbi:MAG: Flp pilus assembly complex ATPase component TadA [Candidatus Omnitrophica bacterium]|nr:Flp pilus assembly complex ATPase component TadA [Candidatus Omnitrophota bacterium]
MAKKLGEVLVEMGLLKPEDLTRILQEQQRTGEFLGTIAVRLGLVREADLMSALSRQFSLPSVRLQEISIDPSVIRLVPTKFVFHHKLIPIRRTAKALTIAIHDPLVRWPLDELALQLGVEVEPVLASESEILAAIRRYYGVGAETVERILAESPESVQVQRAHEKTENIETSEESASVVRLVNQILSEAVREGATDIHIEPFPDSMSLRFRVDGRLYDTPAPSDLKYLYQAIVSRIKIMAGLDVVERRLPQDGRARIRVGEQELDLRISILPTLYGENLVIRMLPSSMILSLDRLGLAETDLKILERLIQIPHGILFVTGPTGSGKTTSLYAVLSRLNSRERSIVTIEDPIEYELKGITQVQVNSKINLSFARTLRNVLRHDPNVLMVGEVRDRETAEIAIQAALTGHLVFSTLHTNDAASGTTRLVDMGIEPYLVSSAVEAFIGQRLVRLICRECREEISPESAAKAARLSADELRSRVQGATHFYRGKGCSVCKQTGYRGRTGIYEILELKTQIQEMILNKIPAHEIKKCAVQLGMRTLQDDGWAKAAQGLTTPEEILRVTQLED